MFMPSLLCFWGCCHHTKICLEGKNNSYLLPQWPLISNSRRLTYLRLGDEICFYLRHRNESLPYRSQRCILGKKRPSHVPIFPTNGFHAPKPRGPGCFGEKDKAGSWQSHFFHWCWNFAPGEFCFVSLDTCNNERSSRSSEHNTLVFCL